MSKSIRDSIIEEIISGLRSDIVEETEIALNKCTDDELFNIKSNRDIVR